MTRIGTLLVPIFGALVFSPVVFGQGGFGGTPVADDAKAPLVTRFYDITPLVKARRHFAFHDAESANTTGAFFGMGGGGVQGGGGMFSVPSVPTQFGGGMGGLGSGGSNSAGTQEAEPSLEQHLEIEGSSIAGLIESSVATESWENSGEGIGTIKDLGNTLLIRQTEIVHAEIGKFLNDLTVATVGKGTYKLEAWWIPLADADRGQVEELLSSKLEAAVTGEQLTSLSESAQGYHAVLLCREHVTNHTASGKQVPVVVGSTPVVGAGDASDAPIVRTQLLGLMLEASVSSVPEYSAPSKDGKPIDQLELSFRSLISDPDLQVREWIAASGKIDRYTLGKHVAEGTCQIEPGKPTLIAALSQLSVPKDAVSLSSPEMQLIVRITRIAE